MQFLSLSFRRLARTVALLVVLGPIATGTNPASAQHRIFVTSSQGDANLGEWPQAGSAVGLDAADAICQAHASDAGLPAASSYVAWLSDSQDDAYCRAHGLSGKKTENCGQQTLPNDAGPWTRMDGSPFAESIERMLSPIGAVLHPVGFDERVEPVVSSYFTGTRGNGQRSGTGEICDDWQGTPEGFVTLGSPVATTELWTAGGASNCLNARRLLCLRPGGGPPLGAFEREGATAFVTSGSNSGDLSSWQGADGNVGLGAADAVCQFQAEAFDLENADDFKAWLSDSNTDARDRFAADGPWVRPDGIVVAESKADLLDGQLASPINQSPSGSYVGNFAAWTGSALDGAGTGADCNDWTSDAPSDSADIGIVARTNRWSTFPGFQQACDRNARLYCLEDASFNTSACRSDASTLCLGADERFSVKIDWNTDELAGSGTAVDIGRQDSGLFTFFDPNNLELLVKVLNGCAITGHYWVFYGATTDVGFTLTVEDTETGAVREYDNPLGMSAEPIKDVEAFPCS